MNVLEFLAQLPKLEQNLNRVKHQKQHLKTAYIALTDVEKTALDSLPLSIGVPFGTVSEFMESIEDVPEEL
jgi:hypothetical protein